MISVLVPFRDTDGSRTRVWRFVQGQLSMELPDAEVIVRGDDYKDPFNKSLAINRAARAAKGNIFYILDADSLVPGQQVLAAADRVANFGWSQPWARKLRMRRTVTEQILKLSPREWAWTWSENPPPEQINTYWAAPPLLLSRDTFFDAGGMDERYRGWGGEDSSFARALWQLGHGRPLRIGGICLHLWHPHDGDYGRSKWVGQDELFPNRPLDEEYLGAHGRAAMRRVIEGRGETMGNYYETKNEQTRPDLEPVPDEDQPDQPDTQEAPQPETPEPAPDEPETTETSVELQADTTVETTSGV